MTPIAIYKPTGANNVDASKAMGSFTGWTFAAVNAIASEVANIQLRLYQTAKTTRPPRIVHVHHESRRLNSMPAVVVYKNPGVIQAG